MTLIRVINPNSNKDVTLAMNEAVQPLRLHGGPKIECITLSKGPFGVESDKDVEMASSLVLEEVVNDTLADAFVIACYSDPGLTEARKRTRKPVFGMAESAILMAVTRGGDFGVISILDQSVPRHIKHLRERGMEHFCAGDRPINMTVAESASGTDAFTRLTKVGTTLRDKDGAKSIILGCAGMAKYREALEFELGIPVIDPVQAGAAMALGAVCLDK